MAGAALRPMPPDAASAPAPTPPLTSVPGPVSAPAGGGWHARLQIDYRLEAGRTLAHDAHVGPLRVLQPLYPEGEAICHHVLVHPPGGIVGGDELRLQLQLAPGSHALITTPGATRFYRSDGRPALQHARLLLQADARLEWLPLETIAYPGCEARNEVEFELAPGSQLLGWDVLALGLPAAGAAFDRGHYSQRLHWPGHWLEWGPIDAADHALLHGPLGLAGHTVLGTLWWAAGSTPAEAMRDSMLEAARQTLAASELHGSAGATALEPGLLVVRVLARRVEPLLALLRGVRAAWRRQAWGLDEAAPRVWRT